MSHPLKILIFSLFISGCTEVPKEVPQLSMTVGADIASMQTAHRQLVRTLFTQLRRERMNYLKYEWTPRFIKNFVEIGKIKDIASGVIVFDDSSSEFVPPTVGIEQQQLLNSITGWSQEAVRQIELKKQKLIAPLDEKEAEILGSIDAGYSRMLAANAQVTGFLTSLRNVEIMQDQFLEKLGLGDIRTEINDKLVSVSSWAADGLEEIRKVDEKLN